MKDRIKAALELLRDMETDVRPGGMGEVKFKQALVTLQAAMDMPEPEPERIVETTVATDEMAAAVGAKINDVLTGLLTRLGNVESATASILNIGQGTSDKLDGMEDVLGMIAHNTATAEPATAG